MLLIYVGIKLCDFGKIMDFNNVCDFNACALQDCIIFYAATVSMKCDIKLYDLRAISIYRIIKYQA